MPASSHATFAPSAAPSPTPIDPAFAAEAFSLTPDPGRLFASRRHAEALDALREALFGPPGIVVLVAEVGLGKTTLAYALLTALGRGVRTAYVGNPSLPFEGLLRLALADFGVSTDARDRAALVEAIEALCHECRASGHVAVLVVDEAQSLDEETFEQLCLLANLQIVLVGQPELEEKLGRPRLAPVAERVTAMIRIEPLDDDESRRYLAHRLEGVGGSLDMFSAPALGRILHYAGGVPRRMNILCHNALVAAYAAGEDQVSRASVVRAIEELSGTSLVHLESRPLTDDESARVRWRTAGRRVATAIGAGALVLALGMWWWWPAGRDADPRLAATGSSPSVAAAPSPMTMAPALETIPPRPIVVPAAPSRVAAVPRAATTATTVPVPAAPARAPTMPPRASDAPREAPVAVAALPRAAEPPPRAAPPAPDTAPPVADAPPPPAAVAARPAEATVAGVSDAEVRAFLDRYVRAWHGRDVAELRRIGQVADDRQAAALGKYFGKMRDLDVQVEILDIGGSGSRRTVRFKRRDRFRDPTGRRVSGESPVIVKSIVRTPTGLAFARAKEAR